MKRKMLGSLIIMTLLLMAMAIPAFAADETELTDQTKAGNTDVEAEIAESSGEVSYIVTVPKKIDFGKLKAPGSDVDDFVYKVFDVKCVEITNIPKVKVSVMNQGALNGEVDQKFFLTSDSGGNFVLEYNVGTGTSTTDYKKIDTSGAMPANGFDFGVFTGKDQTIKGYAAVNQKQIYPYRNNIKEIAGTYSGKLVFTTAAVTP